MIFQFVSLFIFLGYALLILAITIGWFRLKVFKRYEPLSETKVSVVIAVRNEEQNIIALLNCLLMQDFAAHLLEVIIVDDHSTDKTIKLIQDFKAKELNTHQLKLLILSGDDNQGKKAALQLGIKESKGELIVITDADCTFGHHWISTIASYYDECRPEMILGPVQMAESGNIFGRLQSLEFTSLIATAAGSCTAGFPLLANGANIAFTRHAYERCGGFQDNLHYPSGDDIFLMMSIKKHFGAKAVHFLRSGEALVNTPAAEGLKSFFQQRLRWVSKSRGYTDPVLIGASFIVFLTNGWLILTGLYAVFFAGALKIFLILYGIKLMVDLPLLISYSRFQRSMNLILLSPILEILNAMYTLVIGIAGNFWSYKWKGRKVSPKTH